METDLHILIRFNSGAVNEKIYNSKRRLKGIKVVIKEDLTQRRVELIKKLLKHIPARTIWTYHGKMCRKRGGNTETIQRDSDIRKIWVSGMDSRSK
ncbi:hypothetical protein QE152_g10400 [Popillia japonica]|uniref:Uncharacterized protein n=1 Tax=Popillia japonica TaxID=7064 RepID=A0AAW1LVD1_POPJA